MKKILALFMALALVLSMGTVALADDTGDTNTSGNVDVIIQGASNIAEVRHVTIDWSDLDFTYTFDNASVWDSENHDYTEASAVGWDKTQGLVTVYNHSNVGVSVSASINNATKFGVTATLSNTSFTLDTGVGLTYATADHEAITVSITNNAPNSEENFTIGTITVSIT